MSNILSIIVTNTNYFNFTITNIHTNDIFFVFTAQDWIKTIIAPFLLGIIGFLATFYYSQVFIRKKQSRIGVAILKGFIEEVSGGITLMEDIVNLSPEQAKNTLMIFLPEKSWDGMQKSIPDDILERLICVSKKSEIHGFPIDEIRIHLKNYFENICYNINEMLKANVAANAIWNHQKELYFVKGKYIDASKGVLSMLEYAKNLLENNSKTIWPK